MTNSGAGLSEWQTLHRKFTLTNNIPAVMMKELRTERRKNSDWSRDDWLYG